MASLPFILPPPPPSPKSRSSDEYVPLIRSSKKYSKAWSDIPCMLGDDTPHVRQVSVSPPLLTHTHPPAALPELIRTITPTSNPPLTASGSPAQEGPSDPPPRSRACSVNSSPACSRPPRLHPSMPSQTTRAALCSRSGTTEAHKRSPCPPAYHPSNLAPTWP